MLLTCLFSVGAKERRFYRSVIPAAHTRETEGLPSSVVSATYSYWTPTTGELKQQTPSPYQTRPSSSPPFDWILHNEIHTIYGHTYRMPTLHVAQIPGLVDRNFHTAFQIHLTADILFVSFALPSEKYCNCNCDCYKIEDCSETSPNSYPYKNTSHLFLLLSPDTRLNNSSKYL